MAPKKINGVTYDQLCDNKSLLYRVYFEGGKRLCFDILDFKETDKKGNPRIVKGLCEAKLSTGGKSQKDKEASEKVKYLKEKYCKGESFLL